MKRNQEVINLIVTVTIRDERHYQNSRVGVVIATFGNACDVCSELLNSLHSVTRCTYFLDAPGISSSSFEEEGIIAIVSPLDSPG